MNIEVEDLDVAVVIVSWNAKRFLVQCLNSLYAEGVRRVKEIIVVDNASSDGSPEAVEERFQEVRVIRNSENLGFAKANNVGVGYSTARYVCFMNSDAEVIGDCIGQLVSYCEQHSDVGMVGPRVIGSDGKLQRSCRGFPTLWNTMCRALALDTLFPKLKIFTGYSMTYWPQEELREVDMLSGCFWLARREAMNDVGLLDENFFIYAEDMDWSKRYWAGGWKLVFVPSAQAIHYGGGSSANAPVRFAVELQRAVLKYWRKHHSSPAAICCVALWGLHSVVRATGYKLALILRKGEQAVCRQKIKESIACLEDLLHRDAPARNELSRKSQCASS